MGQTQTVSKNNTVLFTDDNGMMVCKLHQTDVVKWDHEKIILKSGGWQTVTTKTRMTQVSNQFNLPFGVFQRDFEWFVDWKGEEIPFEDGMVLTR